MFLFLFRVDIMVDIMVDIIVDIIVNIIVNIIVDIGKIRSDRGNAAACRFFAGQPAFRFLIYYARIPVLTAVRLFSRSAAFI